MSETQAVETETWELAGWAGVDSGRLLITDPAYARYGMKEEEFETGKGGVDCWAPHGQCIAVIVGTQGGDGLFPVSVMRDDKGRITAVRADFTQEARQVAHEAEEG